MKPTFLCCRFLAQFGWPSSEKDNFGIALGLCATLALANSAAAQVPGTAISRLGVDRVITQDGKQFFGVILDQDELRIRMALQRDWFATAMPGEYADHRQLEREEGKKANVQLLQRLDTWINDRTEDSFLIEFLEREKARLNAAAGPGADMSSFVVLSFSREDIRNVYVQPLERRRIAGLAWKHRLSDVTNRSVPVLRRELEELGVDVSREQVDMSDELPLLAQSETEWKARVALIEYDLRKPIDFQGTGNILVRTGNQVDPSAILSQMFAEGQRSLIKELLQDLDLPEARGSAQNEQKRPDDTQWWQTATRVAEGEGFRGVRVTRVNHGLSSTSVSVETLFLAKLAPGEWRPLARFEGQSDVRDPTQEEVDAIASDPRVQNALDKVKLLGALPDDGAIHLALRHGAATQRAMTKCTSEFTQFLNRYVKHVDAPPLSAR